jgi:hypothetical protein
MATSSRDHLVHVLSDCAAKCYNCSERASEMKLDCERLCRATSQGTELLAKWIMNGAMKDCGEKELCDAILKACHHNTEVCSKHEHEHCKECAAASEKAGHAIEKYMKEVHHK